jgi:hypothetical protein
VTSAGDVRDRTKLKQLVGLVVELTEVDVQLDAHRGGLELRTIRFRRAPTVGSRTGDTQPGLR